MHHSFRTLWSFHRVRQTGGIECFKIAPLLNFLTAQQICDGDLPLITNLLLFFNYDVILRVHASIVCVVFRLFCDISLTTYRTILKFTSNDAESTISYKCSVHKKSSSATENKLTKKFDSWEIITTSTKSLVQLGNNFVGEAEGCRWELKARYSAVQLCAESKLYAKNGFAHVCCINSTRIT